MLKKLLILSVFSFSFFVQAKQSLSKMIIERATFQEIKTAIEQGADINKQGFLKYTPLIMVTGGDYSLFPDAIRPKVAKLLIESGADVNAKDFEGRTALMKTSYNINAEITKALLEAGADVNARDKSGMTALSYIFNDLFYGGNSFEFSKKTESVAKLLVSYGADVNAMIKGRTLLMRASSARAKTDMVKLLLSVGADVNVRDKKGRTALTYAYKKKSWYTPKKDKADIVQALLQAGAIE